MTKRRPLPFPRNLIERRESQPNGCIHWTGLIDRDGYGQVTVNRKHRQAHRLAYELWVGPIPAGHQIDHACHNEDESCAGGSSCLHRRCVNPEHLRPSTSRENSLASPHTSQSINLAKTHCPQGHEYDGVNNRGARTCSICLRAGYRRYHARQRKEG